MGMMSDRIYIEKRRFNLLMNTLKARPIHTMRWYTNNMTSINKKLFIPPVFFLLFACAPGEAATQDAAVEEPAPTATTGVSIPTSAPTATQVPPMTQSQFADVLSVQVTGQTGAYHFAVEITSPDTGCEQYADWWEVFSEDEDLLYRRILLHSHVGEQPFTRSGGPVNIETDTVVYVRAHMNTVGYGGVVMRGTAQDGFEPAEVEAGFGSELERVPPQPEDCAF
jgi:hypothetical protein